MPWRIQIGNSKLIVLDTSPKDRVNQAIKFQQPDRVPKDFAAVPEIWRKLADYLGTEDRGRILKHLDVDCRIVSYDSFCCSPDVDPENINMNASQERSSMGGMWRSPLPDGSNLDIWGAHRKRVSNPSGELEQFASFPLESAGSIEELSQYRWPKVDWWDFSNIRAYIESLSDTTNYNIRFRLGSFFETAWSLYNFEKFQLDMLMNPEMPKYVMDRIAEIHVENLRTVLEMAGDLIDIVYFYDDVATQNNLLISPELYEEFILPHHKRVIDLATYYGKPVMMHCCGSVYPLIETLIQMGLKILNPIQPSAANMQPEKLIEEFGGRIAFHGGIDVQQFLPSARPEEVKEKVYYTSEILGKQGGYILSGSHHLQADIPLENVLAMYGVK
jgi:uroporphyrinogen decarboxylase